MSQKSLSELLTGGQGDNQQLATAANALRPDVPVVPPARKRVHTIGQLAISALGLGTATALCWSGKITAADYKELVQWSLGGGLIGGSVVPGLMRVGMALRK